MATSLRDRVLNRLGAGCDVCGAVDVLEVHHRDRNRKNNRIDNFQVLCRPCHRNLHALIRRTQERERMEAHWEVQRQAERARWAELEKQTVIVSLDRVVLEDLQRLARDLYGTEDIGHVISDMRRRENPSLGRKRVS